MRSFDFLENYDGEVKVNGKKLQPGERNQVYEMGDELDIQLTPRSLVEKSKFRITVKGWMANNSGNLDFHQRWNNGIPMPTQEIVCEILGETPGMWKVDGTCSNGQRWVGFISKSAVIEKLEI